MKVLASVSTSLAAILMLSLLLLPVNENQALVVSAPASMMEVLTSLKPDAERVLGLPLLLNFGASGALRSHIEYGAKVDVYISAAVDHMDRLERDGLLALGTRRDLLSNKLALIGDGSLSAPGSWEDLRSLLALADRIAIGDPDSVPAGGYAIEVFSGLGLPGQEGGRLILGGNVRQVLAFVASGSAPLGLVFISDAVSASAQTTGHIEVLHVFPTDSLSKPVIYPAAVLTASGRKAEGARLIDFFRGEYARAAFKAAGFGMP